MKKIVKLLSLIYALILFSACISPAIPPEADGILRVHIVDVGQGDGILLEFPDGRYAVVDACDESMEEYISDNNVGGLAFALATHPHADHIGGLAQVIKKHAPQTIYMPDAQAETKVYDNLLDAAEKSGAQLIIPEAGDYITGSESDDFSIRVLAPLSQDYKDLNNYSVVLRVVYGKTSFLLTGDAEDVSENEMLESGQTLRSDVLKIGHHGSNSSSTAGFLDAVQPLYAAVSCGKGNDYGHPHDETLTSLSDRGIAVFRTDELGSIVFSSDGEKVTVNKPVPAVSVKVTEYIGNKNSKTFHKPTCKTLPAEKNRVTFETREAAVGEGYKPCGSCKP